MNPAHSTGPRPGVPRPGSDDSGMTLMEVLVAMTMLTFMVGVIFQFMTGMERFWGEQDSRGERVNQTEMAMWDMDRQIRSANLIYAPTRDPANDALYLKVYTQVDGINRCVEWRVLSDGLLQRRGWSPTWEVDGQVDAWKTMSAGIQNSGADTVPDAFSLSDGGSAYGNRLLNVTFIVDGIQPVRTDLTDSTTAPAPGPTPTEPEGTTLTTSVTGRNTHFAYNDAVCSPNPPADPPTPSPVPSPPETPTPTPTPTDSPTPTPTTTP